MGLQCTMDDQLRHLENLLKLDSRRYGFSRYNIVAQPDRSAYLLFNTRTGAFSILSEAAIDTNTVSDLLAQGYVVEKEKDETAEIVNSFRKAREDKSLLRIIVLPAEMCNFRCMYCYESFRNIRISKSIMRGLLNLIENRIGTISTLQISWFGGEPLLALDEILFINQSCQSIAGQHRVQFYSDVTTNGYLLEPAVLSQLIEAGIMRYHITIDGVPDVHNRFRRLRDGRDTFDKIWENLCWMKTVKEGIHVMVRTNFDLQSSKKLSEWIDLYSAEFGSDPRFQLFFRPVFKTGTKRDSRMRFCSHAHSAQVVTEAALLLWKKLGYPANYFSELMLPHPRSVYCYGALNGCFVLGADGKLWKCTVGLDEQNQVGVLTDTGGVVFRKQKLEEWNRHCEEWLYDQECLACLSLPLCLGGCILARRYKRKACFLRHIPIRQLMEAYHAYYKEMRERG